MTPPSFIYGRELSQDRNRTLAPQGAAMPNQSYRPERKLKDWLRSRLKRLPGLKEANWGLNVWSDTKHYLDLEMFLTTPNMRKRVVISIALTDQEPKVDLASDLLEFLKSLEKRG